MTDRRKTVLILGMTSLFMFSPLAMSLFWYPIPLFQNLGFKRESIAPPLAWILAKGDFKFILPAILSTSVLGILLAVIYLVGGRNL